MQKYTGRTQNRGVRKAVAKHVTEAHKMYPNRGVRKAVAKFVSEALQIPIKTIC